MNSSRAFPSRSSSGGRPDNGASYDSEAAEFDGVRTWLGQRGRAKATHAKPNRESARAGRSGAANADLGATSAAATRVSTTSRRVPKGGQNEVPSVGPQDADPVLTALHDRHYSSLVRLAALLVRDIATAEAIVQDTFVALGRAQRRPAGDLALCYLRQSVVHRSRAALRHGIASHETAIRGAPGNSAAEQDALIAAQYGAITSALGVLPTRQREALVLRYYGDLTEPQIAPVMGISRAALRRHTARAMASLGVVLENEHAVGPHGQGLGRRWDLAQDVQDPGSRL